MSSLCKVQIIGRLGNDPDIRTTQSGDSVCNLSIATSESWKDKATGQKKEKVEFHRAVLWGNLADIAGQYLTKGSKVFIEGKLETRKWQDQSGNDKYTTEIVVKGFGGQMIMLDGKPDQSQHDQQKSNGYQPQDNSFDDDVPFMRLGWKEVM